MLIPVIQILEVDITTIVPANIIITIHREQAVVVVIAVAVVETAAVQPGHLLSCYFPSARYYS